MPVREFSFRIQTRFLRRFPRLPRGKKNNKNSKYKRNVFDDFHHLKSSNIKVDKSVPSRTISDINFINDSKEYIRAGRNIKRERDNEFLHNIKNSLPISTPIKEGSFFGDEQLTSVSFLGSNLPDCETEIMNKIECHTNSKIINLPNYMPKISQIIC